MWQALSILLLTCLAGLQFWWWKRYSSIGKALVNEKASRSQLEARQRESSAQKRAEQDAMFNSMAEGVLLLDGNGQIQWTNRSLQQMFDLNSESEGAHIADTLQLPGLEEIFNRVKKHEKVEDHRLNLPGKEHRVIQINAARIHDHTTDKDGAILVFHELTRIKEFADTRQEFVANVSHELRTPLALIKGYVETLLDGAKNDPEQMTRFLQIIDKHTDRLTFLIDDLLAISHLESGHSVMNLQDVVVHEVAESVVSELLSRAQEIRVTVENRIPVDLIAVADAERLHQVLFNLVENAIKYGKENGRVTLGAQTTPEGKVEVWVRDDGPGIPKELRERVFERFYRVDKARSRESGGTGLGLSIVKHIVQAHGGEVWVRSETDHGTTFCFTLLRSE